MSPPRLSAHSTLGKNLAKLDDAEMTAKCSGASNDPKADAVMGTAPITPGGLDLAFMAPLFKGRRAAA